MSPKILRSPIAVALMLVTVFSLLPPVFAGPSRANRSQAQESSKPRRGKNGPSGGTPAVHRTADRTDLNRQQEPPADLDPEPVPEAQKPVQQPQTRRSDEATASREPARQQQTASQTRREPPPFDRPPISSPRNEPQAQSGQSSSDTVPQPQRRSQPRREPQSLPPADPGQDPAASSRTPPEDASEDRSSRKRPVLRRPSDSRNTDAPNPQADPADDTRPTGVPPAATDDEPIKLDATLVNIPMLVSDRNGRYIPQLSERDFLLYEDGVQQEIAFFGSEEVAFNVVLLMDMSPSVQDNVDEIHRAAIEFVRQLRAQDRVMIASFDRSVTYLTDFTSNRRVLEDAIRSTRTGSGTSVYDAVYETVRHKLRNIEGRKALILLSDGEDTTSGQASYDDAVDIVTESDVLVYGIRYPGGNNVNVNPWPRNPIPQIPIPIPWPWPWPRRRRGPFTDSNLVNRTAPQWPRRGRNGDFMADITSAGGGPVYDAEKINDLSRLATRIADELRHVYVVSYYPTNSLTNGGYRAIRIRVKNRDDIAIRHRRGYNAREMNRRPTT
jgi:Ca-activated chloride channel homolog